MRDMKSFRTGEAFALWCATINSIIGGSPSMVRLTTDQGGGRRGRFPEGLQSGVLRNPVRSPKRTPRSGDLKRTIESSPVVHGLRADQGGVKYGLLVSTLSHRRAMLWSTVPASKAPLVVAQRRSRLCQVHLRDRGAPPSAPRA